MAAPYHHVPVLVSEVVDLLQPKRNQRFIDGTLGGGGHASVFLERTKPEGMVLGFELDPRARSAAREHCRKYGTRLVILPQSYATLADALKAHPEFQDADGMLLDLGLSSDQLDASGRGFSFHDTGSVDMRFDPGSGDDANIFLKSASEETIRTILARYGEVPDASRVARAIVRLRESLGADEPIRVPELVEAVETASRHGKRTIHPATLVFQAIRMAVNHELERITDVLPQALDAVRSGGRIAVISFHSLEDRLVKEFFKRESRDCLCPPRTPVCRCGHKAKLRIITKKPIRPSDHECRENPRSRSARLRVAEKI